jgi:hypothetical protein
MNEGLKVTGRISWELVRDGVVIERGERDNVITTAGKNASHAYGLRLIYDGSSGRRYRARHGIVRRRLYARGCNAV